MKVMLIQLIQTTKNPISKPKGKKGADKFRMTIKKAGFPYGKPAFHLYI